MSTLVWNGSKEVTISLTAFQQFESAWTHLLGRILTDSFPEDNRNYKKSDIWEFQ